MMGLRQGLQRAAVAALVTALLTLWACATAPVTGRPELLLVPESQEIALGVKAYRETLAKAKLTQDPEINGLVNSVGRRIAAAADRPDYQWEFRVIEDDKTANAFCLSGGKVAVYTGLLPYTKDEGGLAFILAHEVGHALARHGGERLSQQLLVELGGQGLDLAVGARSPAAVQAINQAYGLGATVGFLLPFSRTQESEADHIGLILMAKAGYDPREAPKVFERMMAGRHEKGPPTFLSTHPADAERIRELQALMPEALEYYRH
jgi:predicted Zn-dependent protease